MIIYSLIIWKFQQNSWTWTYYSNKYQCCLYWPGHWHTWDKRESISSTKITAGWRQLATPKSALTSFSPSPICNYQHIYQVLKTLSIGYLEFDRTSSQVEKDCRKSSQKILENNTRCFRRNISANLENKQLEQRHIKHTHLLVNELADM